MLKLCIKTPVKVCDEQCIRGVRQAAWRVRKALPFSPKKRSEVLKELNRVEGTNGVHNTEEKGIDDTQTLTLSVIQMAKLKATNRVEKVEKIANQIKKKYKSLRSAHRCFGRISWKRWHSICKPKKEKHIIRRISKSEHEEILSIWESPDVTITLPFKRYAKKRFMTVTISEAYQKYIMFKKKQRLHNRILSLSSFYRLKPKNIKPRRSLPMNQCTCSPCGNFSLNRDALIANNVKGVPKKSSAAACTFLCPIEGNSIDIRDYKRDCIYSNCAECTPDKIQDKIMNLNPKINWKKNTSWHQWEYIKKVVNGKECSAFERVKYTGTLEELLEHYTIECKDMPLHLLNLEWQKSMYIQNRDVLQPGEVQLVIDYAKNYAHTSQNEPQSAHWDRTQSTLHPISVSHPCPQPDCDERVTNEVVCISPDLKHDLHGVEEFIEATIKMLQKDGVPVEKIYEWSDNCVGQYKSRYAFEKIGMSTIPRMRSFYGENHGKSAADGIVGRLKMHLDIQIKIGNVIDTPKALYEHCQKELSTPKISGCQHYKKQFLYFPEITRPSVSHHVKPVKHIKKQHCVRTTGKKGVIEVRELTCFCSSCLAGGKCLHANIVNPWESVCLNTKDKGNSERNKHWIPPKCPPKKRKTTTHPNPPKEVRPSRPSHSVLQDTVNWDELGTKFQKCTTFSELKAAAQQVKSCFPLRNIIEKFPTTGVQKDIISTELYPHDAPQGYTPISVYGDGNCFTRSLSMICYGHSKKHKELRTMLCLEGVMNKEHYLDNDYLNLNGKYEANLVEYFAIISESYNSVVTSQWNCHIMEKIYENEVLNLAKPGQYCSMWQLYQAANIIGRPIYSIFPTGNMEEFRSRSNRLILPIRYCLRDNDAVAIMWTKISRTVTNPNHFVPVVKM